MESFKEFLSKYLGAIIGVIVAILILCTRLYELMNRNCTYINGSIWLEIMFKKIKMK